jgi:5-methylcytosine-specific restriction endonuclease McrA
MHIDHVIPLARGGEHSYANAQAAHGPCNMRKGATT